MYKFLVIFVLLFSFFNISAKPVKKSKIEPQQKSLTYEYLKSIFPSHLILKLNRNFYLYLPKKNDFSANLVFGQETSSPFIKKWEKRDSYYVFFAQDSIYASRISIKDSEQIIPVINTLIYTFKCLGTPLYRDLSYKSQAETWLIRNVDEKRTKEGFQDFRQVLDIFHKKWNGYNIYLKLNEIKKANGHIEFSLNIIAEKPFDKNKDFLDVRFHTDQDLNIDLVMFFLYENVEE